MPNGYFDISLQVIYDCSLSLDDFVSVSLVRENQRGWTENLKHKIRAPVGGEGSKHQHINKNKTKKCLTNCEDQINDLFVTTSNYPNKKTFKEREEFCLLVKKLIR